MGKTGDVVIPLHRYKLSDIGAEDLAKLQFCCGLAAKPGCSQFSVPFTYISIASGPVEHPDLSGFSTTAIAPQEVYWLAGEILNRIYSFCLNN